MPIVQNIAPQQMLREQLLDSATSSAKRSAPIGSGPQNENVRCDAPNNGIIKLGLASTWPTMQSSPISDYQIAKAMLHSCTPHF
jgi:hypothetical protein